MVAIATERLPGARVVLGDATRAAVRGRDRLTAWSPATSTGICWRASARRSCAQARRVARRAASSSTRRAARAWRRSSGRQRALEARVEPPRLQALLPRRRARGGARRGLGGARRAVVCRGRCRDALTEHLFVSVESDSRAWSERDRRHRRPRAQPQERLADAAARRARRADGALGVGQVLARLRHDLRRGPAPLRRVALGVRAPVPRADGQARRRLDRGALAGDLDRPEDDLAQPALDGRHGHRDLRLPAPAVGPDRRAALPRLRRADRRADDRADRRPGARARGGDALHGAGAGRAGPQGRVRQAARGAARGGLRARPARRRAAQPRRGHRALQAGQAQRRGRRRPARDARRRAQAPRRLDRDRGRRSPAGSSR